ncbi:unnamed protein product [Hydatigera taeniaeformis]|uniref:Uncharacterized protein n=1 Tax=Hydatigena taeniaeformis TaxID=6205 RepID=A0A0R3WTK7_HYDTA|nr:unnamed protein product [Hydatigera taeniaeformis]
MGATKDPPHDATATRTGRCREGGRGGGKWGVGEWVEGEMRMEKEGEGDEVFGIRQSEKAYLYLVRIRFLLLFIPHGTVASIE